MLVLFAGPFFGLGIPELLILVVSVVFIILVIVLIRFILVKTNESKAAAQRKKDE